MVASLLLALLLAASASAEAIPSPDAQPNSKGHTFQVHHRRTDAHSPDPAARLAWLKEEMLRTRLKYAKSAGLDRAKVLAKSKRSKRDVEVQNWGSSYAIQVDVGTPPQRLDTFIDTGSSDFWVIGSCQAADECGMSKLFRADQSSTFVDTGKTFNLTYLKGETVGVWGEDVVSIDGQAHRTFFGVSNYTTEWGTEQDALMGLGFQAASSGLALPWWEAAAANWTEKRYGMYLARTANWTDAYYNPDPQGGTLTFGGIETDKFYGEASYYPLVGFGNEGLWTMMAQGFAMNGRLISTRPVYATTDTGTSIIMGPDADVAAFYRAIDPNAIGLADGSWVYACGPETSVNASFSFGSASSASAPPRQFSMWDGDLVYLSAPRDEFAAMLGGSLPSRNNADRYCLGNIMGWNQVGVSSSSLDNGYWLIGSPFLRNVYGIYRMDPPAQGLAPLSAEFDKRYGDAWNPTAPVDGHNPNDPGVGGGAASGSAGVSTATRTGAAGGASAAPSGTITNSSGGFGLVPSLGVGVAALACAILVVS